MSTSSTADLSETLELMFRYCEKATKFEKISHLFLKLLSNKVEDFKKFLMLSQNI